MTRALYMCWPGTHAGQRSIWSMLELAGLGPHVEFIQQINAFLNGRDSFPDRLDLAGFDVAKAVRQCRYRDWHPKPPALAMPDFEASGGGQSSMWQGWIRKYPAEWVNLWSHFARGTRDATGLPVAAFGIPLVGKDPAAFPGDDLTTSRWAAARRIIDAHDAVLLNLYPPYSTVPADWLEDADGHAQRAATHFKAAQMFYRKPVIPMLWPRWGMDSGRYAEIYCEALASAGADSVCLWINPQTNADGTPGVAQVYADAVAAMIPSLRRFVGAA